MVTPMPTDAHATVEEVTGPPLTPVQAWALIGLGVVSLLMTGVQSALLGALADEHRLSASGVGVAATLEALTMAVTLAVVSVVLPARRLRLWGVAATLGLAVSTLLVTGAHGQAVFAVRAAAGVAEGLLLWLASVMIARAATPERWAALLFLVLSLAQLAISAALGAVVLPRFGADGGYVLLAVLGLSGLAFAALSPAALGPLPGVGRGAQGLPPPAGWVGLFGILLYTGATGALSVYLVPLAQAAGLSAGAARLALSTGLGVQIVGSALAAALAGRVGWFSVFVATTVGYLFVWGYYLLPGSTWPFVVMTGFSGLVAMFVPPFLLPMLIQADPTRRAALQSAGAQLMAAALGPFVGAWAVEAGGMRLMVLASAGLLLGGMLVFTALRFAPRRARP